MRPPDRAIGGRARRTAGFLAMAMTLLYLAISLDRLDSLPPVHEDEPLIASAAKKLATQGVFGSDLYAGYYGSEHHMYAFLPVYPVMLAAVYRVAGFGLLQTRATVVGLGLMVLALTYALGRRLFNPSVGAAAVGFLLLTRLTGTGRSYVSGIPLLDLARIGRYDILVPVFGLAALWTYLSARRAWHFALIGVLCGLAALSHLYGAFWLIALGALAWWDRVGPRALGGLVLGAGLPWLVYGAYVASGASDWVGQTRVFAPRFQLLDAGWYLRNLLQEYHRYGAGLGPPGWDYLARPGFWVAAVLVSSGAIALARRSVRSGDRAARLLMVPSVVLVTLLAVLIQVKLANYRVTVLPLEALIAGWAAVALWRWAGAGRGRWLRPLLAAVGCAVAIEGGSRLVLLHRIGRVTSPYPTFAAGLRAQIPAGARVLALHNYWFGLDHLDYRSWVVPLVQTDRRFWRPPLSIEEALDRVEPAVILVDARVRAHFAGLPPGDATEAGFRAWMARRHLVRASAVTDPTYGEIEVYRAP